MESANHIALAFFDFVPVIAFLIGGWFLARLTRLKCRPLCAKLMWIGVILIFIGGFTKALSKLLWAYGVTGWESLGNLQFMFHAPGFLLMFIASWMLFKNWVKAPPTAVVAAMAAWKIPLLAIMTVSSIGLHVTLGLLAFRKHAPFAGVLFIFSMLITLGMAGMSGGEQTVSREWIEESVNAVGQISFSIASILIFNTARAER
jgi:hypothetical protein